MALYKQAAPRCCIRKVLRGDPCAPEAATQSSDVLTTHRPCFVAKHGATPLPGEDEIVRNHAQDCHFYPENPMPYKGLSWTSVSFLRPVSRFRIRRGVAPNLCIVNTKNSLPVQRVSGRCHSTEQDLRIPCVQQVCGCEAVHFFSRHRLRRMLSYKVSIGCATFLVVSSPTKQ